MHRDFDRLMREIDARGRDIDRWQASQPHHRHIGDIANQKRDALNRERDALNRERDRLNREFDRRQQQLHRYAHQHH